LQHLFLDLGMSPLANSYLDEEQLLDMEPTYPLRVFVCDSCFLVQLPEFESPEAIFSDYAYFSGFSDTWIRHVEAYAEAMCKRFALGSDSSVVEIASNDGCLLRFFQQRRVPVLGIEPARNVAEAAREAGVPTLTAFFGTATASELVRRGQQADLLLGNNVLAHVPDINDFIGALKIALKPEGVITMEFPHLLRLMEGNQFDTIYHEHFSYLSLTIVHGMFARHGLKVFDVEELSTHGGSLRVFAAHEENEGLAAEERVATLMATEAAAGLGTMQGYLGFNEQVEETKRKLLAFLIEAKRSGKSIAAYGAPAKGNTLLNYCGVGTDFIDYTVDRNPEKQGRFLPGSHIPVYPPERLRETSPDYVLILPWNLADEIVEQMADVRDWGGRFVVAIPETRIL
jgi:SAM-dependent methyltransferase